MVSNVQLVSELRNLINQIATEKNPELFRLHIETLLEQYEVHPPLQAVEKSLNRLKEGDNKALFELEIKANDEIEATNQETLQYCEKHEIEFPSLIMESYQQKSLTDHDNEFTSWSTINNFHITRDILSYLLSTGHVEFVKKITIINQNGDIESCTFSPSFILWAQKKETLKTNAPWYSLEQLRRYKNKKVFSEEAPFSLAKNNNLQELQDIMFSMEQKENISLLRQQAITLYEHTKQNLVHTQKMPCEALDVSYDENTNILSISGIAIEFNQDDIEEKFVHTMTPGGKPFPEPMPLDDIIFNMFDAKKATRSLKDKAYKARDRINSKIEEATGIKNIFISCKNKKFGAMCWNPEYEYKK